MFLPTIWGQHWKRISSVVGLTLAKNCCALPSSQDVSSSLPTCLNCSAMVSCLGMAMSHINYDQPYFYISQCSADPLDLYVFWKDKQCGLLSSFWTATGSMLMCSNINPTVISKFMSIWDSTSPFLKSTLKNHSPFTTLFHWHQWYIFHWRGRPVITIPIYNIKLLVLSNIYYNHVNLRCTLCTNTCELNRHWAIRIFNTIYSKAAD